MPTQPPRFRPAGLPAPSPRTAWSTTRKSRQERGYGRAHELMRDRVLREEPLCRICTSRGHVRATTIADHIVPKAEGGGDDRGNYQGLCDDCSARKTAEEAARARGVSPPRHRPRIGADGWPIS